MSELGDAELHRRLTQFLSPRNTANHSLVLVDCYRSFRGTAVEENVCRGICSMIRHCFLCQAITYETCDDV